MKRALSADQIEKYDELRGYKETGNGKHREGHQHGMHGKQMD